MRNREATKTIHVGPLALGGQAKVLIQSMCSIKTSRVEEVAKQIEACARLGADLMRVSVLDEEDARAIAEIKKRTRVPLVADIHFSAKLALLALEAGVDAIRLNPGNLKSEREIAEIVASCQAHHAAIRIGVNAGSLDKDVHDGIGVVKGEWLVESAKREVALLEKYGFREIAISLKGSDIRETIAAYRLAAEAFPYPLHLGITEAGPKDVGLLRSAAGLAPLLLEGIGDTIRISLSDDPEEEVKACCRLLHDLGLKDDYPTFISCPTCGRTQVPLIPVAKAIQSYLEERRYSLSVAVMGCVVNGPGEAKEADLGCAGGRGEWALFRKGVPFGKVSDAQIVEAMIQAIEAEMAKAKKE